MHEKCLHNDSFDEVLSLICFEIINHKTSLTSYPIPKNNN